MNQDIQTLTFQLKQGKILCTEHIYWYTYYIPLENVDKLENVLSWDTFLPSLCFSPLDWLL